MAVRHEVENLIRRGNIFYWRARVPAAFIHCRPGSRLSLSLHCSDHRKAQIIARQLNTRLAELKMNSKDVMTTKKQLQILFEHVRDEEIERLDDVSTMAKRNGRGGDVVEMELDLEVGWACQLLAKFGTRSELSLEGDCSGLTYLLKNGVPASHVDAIRANYRGELSTARSPGLEDGIRRLIYHFEIEDTALNRERAMSKMFEARAAALLDIDERHDLVDRSLSEFTGGGRASKSVVEEKTVELEPAAASSLRLAKESKPKSTATDILEAPEIAYLELSPRTAPPNEKGALGIQKPSQRMVAVTDFEQECEKLIANMGKEWEPATARDAMALVRMKTAQSERLLPMPEEMVRLGFINYYHAIKKLGYAALFPDLFSDQTKNDPGDRFYDTFIPVMRGALGEKMWSRSIHALRHGMADTLKQAGVSPEVIDDISGRLSEGSETNTRYTNPAGLPLMRDDEQPHARPRGRRSASVDRRAQVDDCRECPLRYLRS
jgi:hypothetical protein